MKESLRPFIVVVVLIISTSCGNKETKLLYAGEEFSLFGNRIEQGEFKAVAVSDNKIVSDYQSPANAFFDPHIFFKFSINGRDNEAPAGQDHEAILVPGEDGSIVIKCTFGVKDQKGNNDNLKGVGTPPNTPAKFEVDMRSVIAAFNSDGFYTDFSGNKLFKNDFKGVWIAGGTNPLSWDFENLQSHENLRLNDPDGDGIYTNELIFNVYDPSSHTSSEKTFTKDLSKYPDLQSPFPIMNALYRLSLEEMLLDIRPDSTFMAGKEWNGVWTRDISYSIILSLAAIEPQIARKSLMYKVKDGMIIQDTGTGGSWPVSTDRQVWALAAWEVYKTTGDTLWLGQAYDIISKSMKRDINVAFNPETDLFYGESSFLDWRKQTYPLWMEPVDIYRSHNLGTNAVFYGTLTVLDKMGLILGIENEYGSVAESLKTSINNKLWIEEEGYYGQYLYGRYSYSLSPRSESLGEALCILLDIASEEQKKKMFQSVPVLGFGVPCIYPQIPGIPPYHNNTVWPFVQAYWTWAGARSGNTAVVEHGIASIFRQAALFLTNKENMVSESGDFNGTQVNSDYQLWSVAGNLAIIYRVLFGMQYESDGISFSPFIPEKYDGLFRLEGLRFRQAVIDIEIEKFGDGIAVFEIDGKRKDEFIFPASLTGKHSVLIVMNEKKMDAEINLTPNKFSPDTPVPEIVSEKLTWPVIEGAASYRVFHNGKVIEETQELFYTIPVASSGVYQVMAVDPEGTGSFLSIPLPYSINDNGVVVEAEQFAFRSIKDAFGFTGSGFVELKPDSPSFFFDVTVSSEGQYIIQFRYANGNGPVNTDNKCAQRSLLTGDRYAGTAVFPQRGRDEWSDWGLSNPLKAKLTAGRNRLELRFMDFNNNMNVEENSFLLDNIIVFPEELVE